MLEFTNITVRTGAIRGPLIALTHIGFGLASFSAEQRRKEIGVRKALGASVSQIVMMLSKDFTRLVLIAYVVASPIAYVIMKKWLDNFAYRIDTAFGPSVLSIRAIIDGAVICVGGLEQLDWHILERRPEYDGRKRHGSPSRDQRDRDQG